MGATSGAYVTEPESVFSMMITVIISVPDLLAVLQRDAQLMPDQRSPAEPA